MNSNHSCSSPVGIKQFNYQTISLNKACIAPATTAHDALIGTLPRIVWPDRDRYVKILDENMRASFVLIISLVTVFLYIDLKPNVAGNFQKYIYAMLKEYLTTRIQ